VEFRYAIIVILAYRCIMRIKMWTFNACYVGVFI